MKPAAKRKPLPRVEEEEEEIAPEPPKVVEPPPPHAITERALALLVRGVDQPLAFDKKAVSALTDELASYKGDELVHAVRSLIELARFMEVEQKSSKVSVSLIEIASTAVEALNARKMPQQRDRLRETAARFAQFGGQRRAPAPTPIKTTEPALRLSRIMAVPGRA